MTVKTKPKKGTIQKHGQGVRVPTTVKKKVSVRVKTCSRCPQGCVEYKLHSAPKRIAVAMAGMEVVTGHPIGDDVCGGLWMPFGQDLTHHLDEAASHGMRFVGSDVAVLQADVRKLPKLFAKDALSGAAPDLVEAFLSKKTNIELFTDGRLDAAVEKNQNFIDFASLAMGAQATPNSAPKLRIHQSLEQAGWDVNRAMPVLDLGAPAFNHGRELIKFGVNTEDFASGLALTMNGIQYVMIDVESYSYVSCQRRYKIDLRFALYDVFGLDDKDLAKFGAPGRLLTTVGAAIAGEPFTAVAGNIRDAMIGITAWWQLQHHFDYAPLITRALVRKSFEYETTGA